MKNKLPVSNSHFSFHASNIKRALKNLLIRRDPQKVVISPHMGLGDHLVCIGLIRAIANENQDVVFYYACSQNICKTMSWVFNDIKNIFILPIKTKRDAIQLSGYLNALFLPLDVDTNLISNYEEYFYSKFDLPFSLRWEGANVPPGSNSDYLYSLMNPRNESYILVCNVQSDNIKYNLNIENPFNKKIIYVEPITENLYD